MCVLPNFKKKKEKEKKAHSIVLLLRCIDIEHQTGERVLRVNSKVMFHRPPCFGGKAVTEMKHPHKKTIKPTCVSAKSGDSTAPGTTTYTTVFSLYTGGSVMVCVNGEPLFHSVVLLLVLRCIHVDHHIGESVLRDNSKVMFHRLQRQGSTIKIKDTERPDPNK